MSALTARLTTALAGRYHLAGLLGEGGMATVHLAEDLRHHRKVAVKVLRPELATALGGAAYLRYSPWFDGLRGEPSFQRLIATAP